MTVAAETTERASILCPECLAQFTVNRKVLGRSGNCPKCGKKFKATEIVAAGKSGSGAVPSPEPAVTQPTLGTPAGGTGSSSMPSLGSASGSTTPKHHAKADARLGTVMGPFKITGILGQGGMGTVYEAEDINLQRKVAVKVLPPELTQQGSEAIERFLREARSASRLEHPNIVTIYQVGVENGTYFIAMQLIRGGSAADFLKEHGPMTPVDACRVVKEAGRALAAAHTQGVVHRDIKPANIMLGPSWMIKVADFGLAKIEGSELTTQGGVMGTPSYMSPEACRGEPTDGRGDLYSLGAMFFCLLVGHPPYRGENSPAIMFKHCYEPIPDPRTERPNIPESVVRVLNRLLEKDKTLRYQTADEVIADIDAIDFSGAPAEGAEDMQNWAALVAATQGELSSATEHDALPSPAAASGAGRIPPAVSRPASAIRTPTVRTSAVRPKPAARPGSGGIPMGVWLGGAAAVGLVVALVFAFSGSPDTAESAKSKTKKPADRGNDETKTDPIDPVDPGPFTKTPDPVVDVKSGSGVDPAVRDEFEKLLNAAGSSQQKGDKFYLTRDLKALMAFYERHKTSNDPKTVEFAENARSAAFSYGRGSGIREFDDSESEPGTGEPRPEGKGPFWKDFYRRAFDENGWLHLIGGRFPMLRPNSVWEVQGGGIMFGRAEQGDHLRHSVRLELPSGIHPSKFELEFILRWASTSKEAAGGFCYASHRGSESVCRFEFSPGNRYWVNTEDWPGKADSSYEVKLNESYHLRLVVDSERHEVFVRPEGAGEFKKIISVRAPRVEPGELFFYVSGGSYSLRNLKLKSEEVLNSGNIFGPRKKRDR